MEAAQLNSVILGGHRRLKAGLWHIKICYAMVSVPTPQKLLSLLMHLSAHSPGNTALPRQVTEIQQRWSSLYGLLHVVIESCSASLACLYLRHTVHSQMP
jgi:hypothetical protein